MENDQNQAASLSIPDHVTNIKSLEIDLSSKAAAEQVDLKKVNRPPVTTKVMLYEYLTFNGLSNESPLFNKLFSHFGENLKLK